MNGEKNLETLRKKLNPILNEGEYVFTIVSDLKKIPRNRTIGEFTEREGTTVIIAKEEADKLGLSYEYIASWITLEVHSSLEAVGLTALFSNELSKHRISCNVIAGYYHDHIFVDLKDSEKAVEVLKKLSN